MPTVSRKRIEQVRDPGAVLRDEIPSAEPVDPVLEDFAGLTPDEARMAVSVGMRAAIEMAREDPAVFCELVLRDAENQPIELQPFQEEWFGLLRVHKRLVLFDSPASGKSSLVSTGYVLWRIGRNPNMRVLLVSNTADQATKLVRRMRVLIERSPALRAVFPHLAPGPTWSDTRFTIQRDGGGPDYTVQGCGVHGNVLGARCDLLVMDDILDYENTLTSDARDELMRWVKTTLLSRLGETAQAVSVQNAWHREDMAHRLAEQGWASATYGVLDAEGNPRWPAHFPPAYIAELREQFGPLEFARLYLCDARTDASSRFAMAWIEGALQLGRGNTLPYQLEQLAHGSVSVTGLDLATVQGKRKGARTVFSTVVSHPDGSYALVGLESGQWGAPEILARAEEHHKRYMSKVVVESNAAQLFITQMLREASGGKIPVESFYTGRNKHDPQFGIESIAAEMALGRWVIPSIDGTLNHAEQEIKRLVQDMLGYSPQAHCGDFLSATWIAREGARQRKPKIETGYINLRRR